MCVVLTSILASYRSFNYFLLHYNFSLLPNFMPYQLIELNDASANIECPLCKQAIIDWAQEQYIQPCEHTLFIAMDLGFEFVADRFEDGMNQNVDELHEDPNMNVFEALTTTTYENLIILKSDLGVENLFRYVGVSDR